MAQSFYIIVDLDTREAVCSNKTGRTLTFKGEQAAHWEITVGLLSSLDEYMIVEVDISDAEDEILKTASAQTKAEVYNVMFDTTSNPES
jgi:hypothetical protein